MAQLGIAQIADEAGEIMLTIQAEQNGNEATINLNVPNGDRGYQIKRSFFNALDDGQRGKLPGLIGDPEGCEVFVVYTNDERMEQPHIQFHNEDRLFKYEAQFKTHDSRLVILEKGVHNDEMKFLPSPQDLQLHPRQAPVSS